mgnify:FL=1
MVPPERPHRKHIPELWEPVKDLIDVVLLQAENLVGLALSWDQVVLVDGLKDETNVSEVRPFLELHQGMLWVFVEHFHWATVDEVNSSGDVVEGKNALAVLDMLILEGRRNHRNQLVIGFVPEFRILEQNFELFLEFLQEVILDYFDFHGLRDLSVELVVTQESVWTLLKVL